MTHLDPEAATRPQLQRLLKSSEFTEARYPEDVRDIVLRNAFRGSRASYALIPYTEHMGGPDSEPLEQQVTDLLNDLMHLCDLFTSEGFEFDSLLEQATRMYHDELKEIEEP